MFWKEKRKTRSDKKVQVAPTIPIKVKKRVEAFANALDQPVMFIGKHLFIEGSQRYAVMTQVAPFMKNGIHKVENTCFLGNAENPSLLLPEGKTDRISIRFTQDEYQDIKIISDMLEVSPSRTVGFVIAASIQDIHIIDHILRTHNNRPAHGYEKELKKLMRYVNRYYPYKTERNKKLVKSMGNRKSSSRNPDLAVDHESYKWDFE